jgi:protein-S-isoprenylcysteine O-methyltransferase Ste14
MSFISRGKGVVMLVFELIILVLIYARVLLMSINIKRQPGGKAKNTDKENILVFIVFIESIVFTVISIPNNWFKIGYIGLPIIVNICGIILITLGLAIRYLSTVSLGKYYSLKLYVSSDHVLVKNGMYKLIRHPIYLGDLLLYFGIGIALTNYIVFVLLSFSSVIAYIIRLKTEERMLIDLFGEKYTDYQRISKKIIPFIY